MANEQIMNDKSENIEYIGKVALDLSVYPGQDFYCDGEVEDELLSIVRDKSPIEYDKIIGERKSWPILYHLSTLRENIVEWIPMKPDAKVLEVGSGCGAITGVLSRKAGSVTCVELSKKRSTINAYRHADCDNVMIHVGNFKDVEPKLDKDFDYICLIGVFEYGQSYIGGETPYEDFLNILKPHLKQGGRIIIAIENKYGLKYFAGCKEDHLGTYFSGIEDYADGGGVRTFSRRGLEQIFRKCGLNEYHFYYPYPDYKFMSTLYSDAYMPGKGELCHNLRNFDQDRMLLFDEKNAFDGLAQDGLFPLFSNSFIAVLGEDFEVKFAKYSNDRAPEYSIKTEISKDALGKPHVRKYPLCSQAIEHVKGMAVAYESLSKKYEGSSLAINQCTLVEREGEVYAEFEFVEGTPLVEKFDTLLKQDKLSEFQECFKEYVKRIGYNEEYPVTDFDLIFSNILVNEDTDTWTVIDYEWTFGKQIKSNEVAFRAIYYYLYEDEKRNKLPFDWVLEELSISAEQSEDLWVQEEAFQSFIRGEHKSMAQMRESIGHRMMEPLKWIDKYKDSHQVNRVQIYEDTGKGHNEEQSYFVREAYQGEQLIELTLKVSGDVKMLRIDPAMDCCMVKILEMTLNGVRVPLEKKKVLLVNGRIVKPSDKEKEVYQPSLVFPTEDPNININMEELDRQPENVLYTRMEIVRIPLQIAQDMAGAVKKLL